MEYCVEFLDFPHHCVSPGQSIVFYTGIHENQLFDECLGGGIIDRTGPSYFEEGRVFDEQFLSENHSRHIKFIQQKQQL